MKRARILLGAIALLTVVGGVFAFKPAKFTLADVYCPISSPTTPRDYCPLIQDKTTTFVTGVTQFPSYKCASLSAGYYLTTYTTILNNLTYTYCTTSAPVTGTVYATIAE